MLTVWSVELDDCELANADRLGWLSATERARASRFADPTDRRRWIVTRLALRGILASEVATHPRALQFWIGESGKPFLLGNNRVHFSISHSGGSALVAVSRLGSAGVDIERRRRVPDWRSLVSSWAADEERPAFHGLREAHAQSLLLRLWTRKEALAKGLGHGIERMTRSAVSMTHCMARVEHVEGDTARAREWTLADLRLNRRFYGAVAIHAAAVPATCFEVRKWSPSCWTTLADSGETRTAPPPTAAPRAVPPAPA